MVDLDKIEGCFLGEDVFVIGAGPSLSRIDISALNNKNTIVVNGAVQLQSMAGLQPDFYVTSDERFAVSDIGRSQGCADLHVDARRIMRDKCRSVDDRSQAYRTAYIHTLGRDGFEGDLRTGFYFGCTSVMLALQLAYFTGARRCFMLGVDLSYGSSTKRFYDEKDPQPVDSFLSVQIWNIAMAARSFNSHNRELIGCSEYSLMRPYVPFMSFSDAISSVS